MALPFDRGSTMKLGRGFTRIHKEVAKMLQFSEFDVRQEIDQIDAAAFTAMRKTRRYLELSRRIRRAIFALELNLEGLDASAAAPVREERRVLHLLDEDVRIRALRSLRATRRFRLGFGYGPQPPKSAWVD